MVWKDITSGTGAWEVVFSCTYIYVWHVSGHASAEEHHPSTDSATVPGEANDGGCKCCCQHSKLILEIRKLYLGFQMFTNIVLFLK